MTYSLHKPISDMDWNHALVYHAFLHNGDVPYNYTVTGSYNPQGETDYNTLVVWSDLAAKPDYTTDLLPLFPIALDWMIDNSREPVDTHLLEIYNNFEDELEATNAEVIAHAALIAGKANTSHTHTANDISDATTTGKSVLTGSASSGRSALGLSTVATSGDYNDLSNKPSVNTTRTTSSLSLSLVGTGATGTQIHASKDSTVYVNVSCSTTATIGGASTSLIALKICSTNNATEGSWTTVATFENDQTVSLAVLLQSVQVTKGQFVADVPTSWYVKLVNSGTGTHSETFISGQKTIYG